MSPVASRRKEGKEKKRPTLLTYVSRTMEYEDEVQISTSTQKEKEDALNVLCQELKWNVCT